MSIAENCWSQRLIPVLWTEWGRREEGKREERGREEGGEVYNAQLKATFYMW